MSYFDSPKNRAMWERELGGLREEKQKRAENGYKPLPAYRNAAASQITDNPDRKKINFETLLREEARAMKQNGAQVHHERERSAERTAVHTKDRGMNK